MSTSIQHLTAGALALATAFAIAYPPERPTAHWSYFPAGAAEASESSFTYLLTITYRDEIASFHSAKACEIQRSFIESNSPLPTNIDFLTREVLCEAIEVTPYDSH